METKLSDTLVKAIDRSNPFMQNLQLASRFNALVDSQGDLENNKEATIDVSAYTEPVEITPTAGKGGMKKATVTLSNIPSGGSETLFCFRGSTQRYYIAKNPDDLVLGETLKALNGNHLEYNDELVEVVVVESHDSLALQLDVENLAERYLDGDLSWN